MSLDNLPIEVRANGLRRRREALGLTLAEVGIGSGLLPFVVEKAERGDESARTYRLLEDWLEWAERQKAARESERVPIDDSDQDQDHAAAPEPTQDGDQLRVVGPLRERRPRRTDAPSPKPGVDQSCHFELTMDGVTITARGPADKLEAMGAIVRGAVSTLKNDRGTTRQAPRTKGA